MVNAEKIKVLYIDDEQNNLNSFAANFRHDFQIYTSLTADGGKELLKLNPDIQVIVADQRMPVVTGVEFFESIIKDFPDPVRILITGYADIEAIINAINRGQVFRYVDKPWNDEFLRQAMMEAHQLYMARKNITEELDYFLYKTSHDLRGPLSSIKGLIELAKNDLDKPESISFYMQLMQKSINQLLTTVNELIDFKKLDQIAILSKEIDFNILVKEVLESLKNLDFFGKVEFRVQIDQKTIFNGDESIIRSLFQNLIHNAINYGRYNETLLSYIKVTASVKDGIAEILIEDNGIGMTPETKNNIFNMFYRQEHSSSGSGLGLYIVKKGLDKVGGKILVESQVGIGTKFKITLPSLK
jgi:signal transduction histidine kinase